MRQTTDYMFLRYASRYPQSCCRPTNIRKTRRIYSGTGHPDQSHALNGHGFICTRQMLLIAMNAPATPTTQIYNADTLKTFTALQQNS